MAERLQAMQPGPRPKEKTAVYAPALTVRKKAIEQNHLILAFPALSFLDERRYQLILLNSILGGGVSSRLFQQVREEQGLCYSVYSYISDHADTGLLGVYTALGKETEPAALETICKLIGDLANHGPTREELERVREQAKANVVMGLESVQAQMSHMGSSVLLFGSVRSVEEILQQYEAVTVEQVQRLAREIFRFDQVSLSAVGRVDSAEGYRQRLWQFAH